MVKILHSADWQMGLRAQHVASVAQQVRKARLDAARTVIQEANRLGVHAVVLAGDIFEDNLVQEELVHQVLEVLAGSRAPVYLLPGNHDALTSDTVYRRASWKQRPAHVHLLEGEPVPLPGTSAVLLSAPLRQKKGMTDPTVPWMNRRELDGIRIGVAHGSLRIDGKHAADDFPIALDAAVRSGLDYLALGHWHGQFIHQERTAYAGAHETTKFGESGSGGALLVEISKKGALPRLTPISTGTLSWQVLDLDLSPGTEQAVARIRGLVKTLPPPERTLLRLRTTGTSSDDAAAQLSGLKDSLSAKGFLHVDLERKDVPRAQVEGRLAQVAESSALITALLGELNASTTPHPSALPEDVRQAARQLLSELVMEEWS